MPIFAKEVETGQPVIYYNFGRKILVRGDDKFSSFINGRIPFCEIGEIKDEKFLFHSIPVDVTFLEETQLFDTIECFIKGNEETV